MLIDLLSTTNLVSFNVKVAEVFGLETAVYLSELMNINEKAIRKNKVVEFYSKQYFTIDRAYLKARTTLTPAKQKELEARLITVEVLKVHPSIDNTIFLDIDLLGSLLGAEVDQEVLNKISNIAKKKSKEELAQGKLEGMRNNAQKAVQTTIPEVRQAWYTWIDAVLVRYNTITRALVQQQEKLVVDFAQGNKDVMLAIITDNTQGYNTMQYSIDKFKQKRPTNFGNNINNSTISLSSLNASEVF